MATLATKLCTSPAVKILLIEDSNGDALLIRRMLERSTPNAFSIVHATTLEAAEPHYLAQPFNLLLLDLNLPGISGMDAVEKLRRDLPHTPLIVMTGLDDDEKALNALQLGAQDYIVKGQYNNDVLPRAIRYAIERKQFENKVVELVHFDRVTGLINRDLFMERMENAMALSSGNGMKLAVMLVSLRRYKEVTATLGHEIGHGLLKAVGVRLKECLMQKDAIARLDGDEFAMLITGALAQPEHLSRFAAQVMEAIDRPFEVERCTLRVGCSIGISTFPACGQTKSELLTHADTALHRAKQNSNNAFQFYNSRLNQELSERIALEKELRQAIWQRQLVNYYQPIIDVETEKVCGVETLARWVHPVKGNIPPSLFIPLAERSDFILELSEYILRGVCADMRQFDSVVSERFYVSINFSTRDLKQQNFANFLKGMLSKAEIGPERIAIEVTEGTLMEDPEQTIMTLKACRAFGASIFVDDFGTGYSSLSYLSRLPLNILKLDQTFVTDMTTNEHNLAIATATINLAHALGLKVVAEGVETSNQYELLKSLGCDMVQGYHFAKPMPKDELLSWLKKQKR